MAAVPCLALVVVSVCSLAALVRTQVAWTPIYVDGNSQVDLWTEEATGCRCSFNESRHDCACCVQDGGCQCGSSSPNRCSQCGLEQHCSNMCNVTVDSRWLSAKSGKMFGQIKSPSMEGPIFCWYHLQPDSGQRVEIQVYRLVSVGRFNGISCEAGFIQLVDGRDPVPGRGYTQLCGTNERYAPPVVLFADRGPATLIFQVGEPTMRSQFLAYFSFTPNNGTQGGNLRVRGGHRVGNTVCDWLYQDYLCQEPGACVLASPGYPGLYPPDRKCRYLITSVSNRTQVRITFTSLLLPQTRCATDYIALYRGSTPTSPPLSTVCSVRGATVQYMGPNILLEFNSGPSVPPYNYNGFVASLEFVDTVSTTELSADPTDEATVAGVMRDGTSAPGGAPSCHLLLSGGEARSGHFDSRSLPWSTSCSLDFRGRATDVVHISLFNYKLNLPSCHSALEVFDGAAGNTSKAVRLICSPVIRHAQDSSGRFLEQLSFVSSGRLMTLLLRRSTAPSAPADEEFVDGAYRFHDEHVEGTLRPSTLCDADHYGLSSPPEGSITDPGSRPLFWNVEGPLRCVERFVPFANQSVTLTVTRLLRQSSGPECHTQCGDGGCRCAVGGALPLHQMDHLLILAHSGQTLACLCGDFQQEWLPISVRSWSALRVVYSLSHHTWTTKGFAFTATYAFNTDEVCGHNILTETAGETRSVKLSVNALKLNHFYHLDCSWLLNAKMEGQLSLEMETNQNRPCTAWNLSVLYHEFDTSDETGGSHTYLLSQGHRQELLFALVTRHGAAAVARHDKDATRIRPQVALTICVCQHSSVRPHDRCGAERCLLHRLRDLQVPLRPQFTRLGCQLLIKFRDGHASPFRWFLAGQALKYQKRVNKLFHDKSARSFESLI